MSREEELLREALEAYRAEYRELHEDWRALDVKAQGTVTVAGIFIAGIFALVKDLASTISPDLREYVELTAVLLTLAIAACVASFFIRDVRVPLAQDHEENVSALLAARKLDDETIANYLRDQSRPWKDANESISSQKKVKATLLLVGQFFLVCSLLGALFIIFSVTNHHVTPLRI